MRKNILLPILIGVSLLVMTSCEKDDEGDEGKLPEIELVAATGYVSADGTADPGETLKFKVEAKKTEERDPLIRFTVSAAFDGGDDQTVETEDLSGDDSDGFTKEVEVTTREQAGTEKYTFTIINKDGLVNSVSVTIEVE